MNDVETFGLVLDFAAGYETTVQEWADDITYAINGTTGPYTLLTAAPGEQMPQFGDTGFHPIYQDGQNQIYHWWAYVNSAVQGGQIGANVIGYVGNAAHEFWDPREIFRQPASGSSWADYVLSENGMSFGLSLYYGYTTSDEACMVAQQMLTTDHRRPFIRWASDHISDGLMPPNVIRYLLKTTSNLAPFYQGSSTPPFE
jgi:hypothetical protein